MRLSASSYLRILRRRSLENRNSGTRDPAEICSSALSKSPAVFGCPSIHGEGILIIGRLVAMPRPVDPRQQARASTSNSGSQILAIPQRRFDISFLRSSRSNGEAKSPGSTRARRCGSKLAYSSGTCSALCLKAAKLHRHDPGEPQQTPPSHVCLWAIVQVCWCAPLLPRHRMSANQNGRKEAPSQKVRPRPLTETESSSASTACHQPLGMYKASPGWRVTRWPRPPKPSRT